MLFVISVLLGLTSVFGQGLTDQDDPYQYEPQSVQTEFKPQNVVWFPPPPSFDVGQGCLHGGAVVPVNESVPSIDGCNRCFCIAPGGLMACTKRYCTNTKGCHVGGSLYQPGAQFPHADGCNTCTCVVGRRVTCTENYWCPPRPTSP